MPISRSTCSIGVAALTLLFAAPSARAQRDPATIPTSLAAAVLGSTEMGMTPHFTVGRPPAGWPNALMPGAPWKVVGGVELGPLRMTLFEGPRSRDLAVEYTALVTRAGFHEAAFGDEVRGGFVSGPPPRSYCSDTSLVAIIPRDSTATTRSLLVHYVSGDAGHACADARGDGRHAPIEIPPLHAPAGARTSNGSSGWSMNSVEQAVTLDGAIPAAEVLDHYTRQLVAGGWTAAAPPLVVAGSGVQALSLRDKNGAEWFGMLAVITTGEQRSVTLKMAKPPGSLRSP